MGSEKFYHFEEGSDSHVIGEKSEKSVTPAKVFLGFLLVALAAALIAVVIYYNTGDRKTKLEADIKGSEEKQSGSDLTTISPTTTPPSTELLQRIDCIPEAKGQNVNVTKKLCTERNCILDEKDYGTGSPTCYFSSERSGYSASNFRVTDLGFKCDLDLKTKGPFGLDLSRMEFEVQMLGNDVIRFKFDDPLFNRYKVPVDLELPNHKGSNPKYEIQVTNNETFSFKIIRKSTDEILWDTGVGGLVLSDQFLQISTRLPSKNVYGFGENLHKSFRHDLNYKTWPMFSRDQAPGWTAYSNLYGVHPFYTCLEEGGNSHGVLLLNSNAQDYSFTPLPMLTYRTIGGILDFYMFLGPEPESVVQQYTGVIGRPYMPPYWSLGFQLCRYGYNSLEKMQEAVNRTKQYNIPHDVQYADIDHMHKQMDFTMDEVAFKGLPEYFDHLRDGGMRTIIILDPTLIIDVPDYEPYDNLTAIEGAIKWPDDYEAPLEDKDNTSAILGYVWPEGKVVFPDFFKDSVKELWKRLIVKHRDQIPFDALWIDMNEPANFGTNLDKPWNWPENKTDVWSLKCPQNNRFEDPPYRTKAAYVHDNEATKIRISDKTICMIARQGNSDEYQHYNVHSLYGWSQTLPTLDAVREATGERSLVLTRSTYPSSGKHGAHWLGDNDSQWPHLAESIIGMLEFNLFGIPYIGADICGFFGNTTAELCKRWMQLGAFYPFSRNHNGIRFIEQDPGYFGEEVANASREALETRYWLLPYLYTLFHRAHKDGNTVVRPLFHEFPKDQMTYGIDKQFMWGPALMIVPILEQGQTKLDAYYPVAATWYDFYTGQSKGLHGNVSVTVQQDSRIGLSVRGGYILPMQKPANNTHFSRQNPMKLLIALDNNGSAEGELFWDDGSSVDTYESNNYFFATFKAEKNSVAMKIMYKNDTLKLVDDLKLDEIQVYGAPDDVHTVYLDHFKKFFDFELATNTNGNMLTVHNMGISLKDQFTITWRRQNMTGYMDCNPEAFRGVDVLTEAECQMRGCSYDDTSSQLPFCLASPKDYVYRVSGTKENTTLGFKYMLEHKGKAGPYSSDKNKDIKFLTFEVEMRGDSVLRFKFDDANNTARYKVPVTLSLGTIKAQNPKYEVKVTSEDPFSFQVIRKDDGAVLWDTGIGGLIFSDQFIQISTALPSTYVYGFGENVHHSFKHDLRYQKWPMFSRDQPVPWGDHNNHYGVHPYYMCMEESGKSHGVLLLNSNAQDYSFTPQPMLTYRTIGGILDFYMFLGPEPETVVQQYTRAVGRPYLPPYWSLGFQLCRYGYNNITNLMAAVDRTRNAGIPYDVQYADIDHMDERKDFTVDPIHFAGLNDYFKSLQNDGMHIIIILDPALISSVPDYEPYDRITEVNGSIMWAKDDTSIPANSSDTTGALLGYVWPAGKAIFPDFFKNATAEVWKELIIKHHKNNLTFDGLWIDMNEPANFGTNEEKPFNWSEGVAPWSLNCTLEGSTIEHPPYRTMAAYTNDVWGHKAMISDKTVCMRAVQGELGQYKHYDVHSLYGWSQTLPTLEGLQAATGERGMVISRSTYPGSGKYAGHWLGDNDSSWEQLRLSVIGILEFNLFGIPYIGADICGFFEDTTEELCLRWMQLGAFYTFSRNHNGLNNKDQDPAALGPDVANASKVALETRYTLLPYLYTLFYRAHTDGHTVIRPLHHVFPADKKTWTVDTQFMWGSALLIAPVLEQGHMTKDVYFPSSRWFDYYTGEEIQTTGKTITVDAPLEHIPLFLHGGYILPTQDPANTTVFSRKNPLGLLVVPDENNTAMGELFWDDGDSIDTISKDEYFTSDFKLDQNNLTMSMTHNHTVISSLVLDNVWVYGIDSRPTQVVKNGANHTSFSYNTTSKMLTLKDLGLPLTARFSVTWS